MRSVADLSLQEEQLLASLARLDARMIKGTVRAEGEIQGEVPLSSNHAGLTSKNNTVTMRTTTTTTTSTASTATRVGANAQPSALTRFSRAPPPPRKPKPVMVRMLPPRPKTQQRLEGQRRQEILSAEVTDAGDALQAMQAANRTK